ncbi:MAG TPA: hypothetical protein VLF94_04630 [Chlamydiales bacterium]|nr:hypothetical protein [Chlamydiales bacterium]
MSSIALSLFSGLQVDSSLDSGCIDAVRNVKTAYENFSLCPEKELRASRNDYFFAINEMYKKIYSDPDSYMHRDVYFNEAKKIIKKGEVPLSQCLLSQLAQEYVDAFGRLNGTLSSARAKTSVISENVFQLAKAHYAFADAYSRAFEQRQ